MHTEYVLASSGEKIHDTKAVSPGLIWPDGFKHSNILQPQFCYKIKKEIKQLHFVQKFLRNICNFWLVSLKPSTREMSKDAESELQGISARYFLQSKLRA